MKLYHGTGEKALPKILAKGIKPRGRRKGNWDNTVRSNPKAVYLTNSYALHYAAAAVKEKGERLLLLEVDTPKLHPFDLVPDEDFLEQASRKDPKWAWVPGTEPYNMVTRTEWFRDHADEFASAWEQSVEHLGNAAYMGTVPPEAITRYTLLPTNSPLSFASDPTISLINYRILGGYYRELMKLAFGDKIDPAEGGVYADALERLMKEDNKIAVTRLEATHVQAA